MTLWSRTKSKCVARRTRVDGSHFENEEASKAESLLSSSSGHAPPLQELQDQTIIMEQHATQLQEMQDHIMVQNQQMKQMESTMLQMMATQCQQMNILLETLSPDEHAKEKDLAIDCGFYEIEHDHIQWSVVGISSRFPHLGNDYFPGLRWDVETIVPGHGDTFRSNNNVVSVMIPCFNEEASDLERTIRGLSRQIMPEGWRVETILVMDGMEAMSSSMARLLFRMFGVDFGSDSVSINPFCVLNDADTVIVHPCDPQAAHGRRSVMDGTIGGFSLLVKRENQLTVNSQQWWLVAHASAIGCKYAMNIDCGTYLERTTVARLIERLDNDRATHAVTGTLRTMPSNLQGDGHWELWHRPFHFLLRQLQRFDVEVVNVTFGNGSNRIGTMPGPCCLYRYNKIASLKGALIDQDLNMFSCSNKGLILGNVELVQDRIIALLLAFQDKPSTGADKVTPPEGWPKIGLVHNAVVFREAEKSLDQLVKQRRRWLNGTFATNCWMLTDSSSNRYHLNKTVSWCLVTLVIFQSLVAQMFGPALLIVVMFQFGIFLPDLYSDPSNLFDPTLSLADVDAEPARLMYACAVGLAYWLLYIAFVLGHIPRVKPVQDERSIIPWRKPTRWVDDSRSAFRAWLFHLVFWINLVVTILSMLHVISIVAALGWDRTPLALRVLISCCCLPFAANLMNSILRCSFGGLWNMIISASFAMPCMIWLTVWLPAYATTRLSDLTWGNRERRSLDETDKALTRTQNGVRVALFLILFNTVAAAGMIMSIVFFGGTLTIFVVTYTIICSATYVVSFLEIFSSAFQGVGRTKSHIADPEDPVRDSFEAEQKQAYLEIEDTISSHTVSSTVHISGLPDEPKPDWPDAKKCQLIDDASSSPAIGGTSPMVRHTWCESILLSMNSNDAEETEETGESVQSTPTVCFYCADDLHDGLEQNIFDAAQEPPYKKTQIPDPP
jgi:cellulose synthase/poly-beta-1,6-N-acetylglucosamine synthase-like glycosyltransferase